jgi:hypothetical protein
MIHVDVRRVPGSDAVTRPTYAVETSTDGAGWALQYSTTAEQAARPELAQQEAENIARIFAAGAHYAGAEVRITSCGAAL